MNKQIDPWAAIEHALNHIDDHYDRAEFLTAALATAELAEWWPEFQGVSE